MDRKTYVRGGRVRVAETPAQCVALAADGWRVARPADPEPPVGDEPGQEDEQQDGQQHKDDAYRQQDTDGADPAADTKTTPTRRRRGGGGATTKH
jgi:hypothetical protein